MTPAPDIVLPSLALAVLPLLLIGTGLLATLLPENLLRSLAGQRDPMAVTMLPFATGLALLGLLVAAFGIADGVRTHHAQRWQPVPARITHSDLVQVMQPRSSNPAWRADVRYSYRFAGRNHNGHRIAPRPLRSSDRAGLADWLQHHYPLGAEATAFVDPHAPTQAVLERDGSPWTWLMAAAGLALAGAGAWLLRTALQSIAATASMKKRKRKAKR